MKTKFATLLALNLTALLPMHAEEVPTPTVPVVIRDSSTYFDIGLGPFPLPLPVFGIGHREQWHHHGLDLHLDLSTIVQATELKGSALYLHYFKPNLASEFYAGAGVGFGGLFAKKHDHGFHYHTVPFISPEFIVGKQYLNEAGDKRFFQAQISWPTMNLKGNHHTLYYPLVVFSYGFMF